MKERSMWTQLWGLGRRAAAAAVCVLAIGGLGGITPALAGGGGSALSPVAQQTLAQILSQLPPNQEQMLLNALSQFTTSQVEAGLEQAAALPPGELQNAAQSVAIITGLLPASEQQTFIDGVVGVSPQEQQFALTVIQQLNAISLSPSVVSGGAAGLQAGTLFNTIGFERGQFSNCISGEGAIFSLGGTFEPGIC